MLKKIFLFALLFSTLSTGPLAKQTMPVMPALVTVGFKMDDPRPLLVSESQDGINWNTFSYPIPNARNANFRPVIWGNHEYLMIYHHETDAGTDKFSAAMVSNGLQKDGSISWTAPTVFAQNIDIWDVIWGNDQYIAVGNKGEICRATQATGHWTCEASPASSLRRVIWANQQYLAVGNKIITSPDGKNWISQVNNLGNTTIAGIVWATNKYVAVGYDYNTQLSFSLTSLDGKTWTMHPINIPNFDVAKVAWGNGQFVSVGSTAICSSLDGITWTTQMAGDHLGLSDVIWANNQFIAVGFKTGIHSPTMTSPDGIHWTQQDSKTDYDLYSVAYNNEL